MNAALTRCFSKNDDLRALNIGNRQALIVPATGSHPENEQE